jgi:hypothetical protein
MVAWPPALKCREGNATDIAVLTPKGAFFNSLGVLGSAHLAPVGGIMLIGGKGQSPLLLSGRKEACRAREGEYLSIFEGSPSQIDAMLRQVREQVVPQAKQMDGFKGMIALGDRQSGKTMGITFWENEEAMRASEEDASRMRSESAEAGGQEEAGIERYEVGFFDVES